MACNFLTSWQMLAVLGVRRVLKVYLAEQPHVVGWILPGKGLEILGEVRLIVIAGLIRDLRPVHRLRGVDTVENVLKAVDTRQLFRRRTD